MLGYVWLQVQRVQRAQYGLETLSEPRSTRLEEQNRKLQLELALASRVRAGRLGRAAPRADAAGPDQVRLAREYVAPDGGEPQHVAPSSSGKQLGQDRATLIIS